MVQRSAPGQLTPGLFVDPAHDVNELGNLPGSPSDRLMEGDGLVLGDGPQRRNYAGTSRSPARPAAAGSCWPATPTIAVSPTPCTSGPSAPCGSPGARAYYQALRRRGTGHQAALRQLSNRLVGILHGYLKT